MTETMWISGLRGHVFWFWDMLSLHILSPGQQSRNCPQNILQYWPKYMNLSRWASNISTRYFSEFTSEGNTGPDHSFPEPQMVQINLQSIYALISSYQWEWIAGSVLQLMLSHSVSTNYPALCVILHPGGDSVLHLHTLMGPECWKLHTSLCWTAVRDKYVWFWILLSWPHCIL